MLTLIAPDEVLIALRRAYLDLDQLVEDFDAVGRERNRTGLEEFRQRLGKSLADFDGPLVCSLVRMGCSLARAAAISSDLKATTTVERGRWWLSFASARNAPNPVRLESLELWAYGRSLHLARETDPEVALQSLRDETVGLQFSSETFETYLRMALIEAVALLLTRECPLSETSLTTIRTWCEEILNEGQHSEWLNAAAAQLGVQPPASTEATGQAPAAVASALMIWKMPLEATREALQAELEDLLVELRSLLRRNSDVLTQRTAEQVRALRPELDSLDIQMALSFAGQNLWDAFTRKGDFVALVLSRRLFLFLVQRTKHIEVQERYRSTTYHWWMNSQLPELIHTCALTEVLKEGLAFYEVARIGRGDFSLREGLIEAVVGECRRLELAGETEERKAFLQEHAIALKQIHSEYVRLTRERQSPTEEAAWAYLKPEIAADSREAVKEPMNTFGKHPELINVLRSGSHEAVLSFVEANAEQISEILRRRLDVRLSPEHLLLPEDIVYQSGSVRKREPHPSFVAAQAAMKEGQFARASQNLDSLRLRLSGLPQAICRNHLAYALARQGDLLAARTHLQALAASWYPAVYWNLACCIPPDQMKQRLDVLAKGLEHAPHPRIHLAAVYLALLLDDERVNSWLRWLPRTEALLLSFRLDFGTLSFEQRDVALTRLRSYVERGEPRCPDPAKRFPYIVPPYQRESAAKFLDSMIELQQPEVFEFWLRCLEVHARRHAYFWEMKVDFLKRVGRMTDAVRAFVEEIPLRLGVIRSLAQQPARSPREADQRGGQARLIETLVGITRTRAAEWLKQAMNVALKEEGQRIFKSIEVFLDEFPDLAPKLRPNDRRVLQYYGDREEHKGSKGEDVSTPISSEDLTKVLASVGAACVSGLHELSQLSGVRMDLIKLRNCFRQAGHAATGEALSELLKCWEQGQKPSDASDPGLLQAAAQNAFATLKSAIDRDLPQALRVAAAPLVESLGRVDRHLARDMALLPSFAIEALEESGVMVDASGPFAFGVRIRIRGQSATVRLRETTATLDDEQTTFTLRDQLDHIPTIVGSDSTAVLTFESRSTIDLSEPRRIRIQVGFEHGGRRYLATPATLEIVHRTSPTLPDQSPYIFGRPLEVNEIETHFFGREAEQKAILHSVRDGQQRMRYVEGIRRAGKSSLLHSIEHEVELAQLPLVPVYVQAASVAASDTAGRILFNFLSTVTKHPLLREVQLVVPSEERCCENLRQAYDDFIGEIEGKCGNRRVLILLDDFQVVVETAQAARELQPVLTQGIFGFLNLLFEHINPRAKLVWVLAGQRAFRQFKSMLPGALLWGVLQPLGVDFLKEPAVAEILRRPLAGTSVVVSPEAISRVCSLTGGHPEVVQQVAEQMLLAASAERRWILTPADAERAARDVAECSDNFATTWYPVAELTGEQRKLIAALLNAIPNVGGRIEPYRLLAGNQLTDSSRQAIDDLIARKILDAPSDGTIGIKAYVLEQWLRRFVPTLIDGGTGYGLHGSVAIFVDVANLTSGTGSAWVEHLNVTTGESGIVGRFGLGTVLAHIEQWAARLSPAPIAARWVVNYPLKSPAVVECNAKGYHVENIPQDLFAKGSDDVVLREKVSQIEQWYPTVNHFVLVTGDKDYRLTADRLLKNGKFVHFVSRAVSIASQYHYLAEKYPQHFTLNTIEELLVPTEV